MATFAIIRDEFVASNRLRPHLPDVQEQRRGYCREAEAMIDAGHVPHELLVTLCDSMSTSIREAIDAYLAGATTSRQATRPCLP